MTPITLQPQIDEKPSSYAERIGCLISKNTESDDKKSKGQFFTPLEIAKFMGCLGSVSKSEISILEPGCGCCILSVSLIEHLVSFGNIRSIYVDLYETDSSVLNAIDCVIKYLDSWLKSQNIQFVYRIYNMDFISTNIKYVYGNNGLFEKDGLKYYDYIIANPPFFKLPKSDDRVKVMGKIINGQTNIYALFMIVSSLMLSKCGQMIYITPRSFTSGKYFQSFRMFLLKNVVVDYIHIFNSRQKTFSKDNVLQELVIMRFIAIDKNRNGLVHVSSSQGLDDLDNLKIKEHKLSEIVDLSTKEKMIYIPVSSHDEYIMQLFKSWNGNMIKYGINISTGPIVAFRFNDCFSDNKTEDAVPVYWLTNVIKMLADHPVVRKNKPQFIKVNSKTTPYLLPNKNYLFLRRFSAKDDKSRLIAAPYFGNSTEYKYVGVENKLNYIYRKNGHLTRSEVMGLAALLNSELFDNYFRMFNGNVNVSATELRLIPLPSKDDIISIGQQIIVENNYSIERINDIVYKQLQITCDDKN